MIKKILFVISIVLATKNTVAQERFFSTIKVEFEKTISVRQLMKEQQEGNNSWYEQNKDRFPISMINYYDFTGDTSKSLYQLGKDVPIDPRSWYRPVGDKNVVYTDYQKGISISQKPVFEETFLVEDSLLKIKWKITGDIRTIAGYDCRKAVGILNDSIAIFAFYSDELLINGGPEGIQGLPGMILGMGIPRLHATWFASKVEVFDVKMNKVMPATKGKKVNRITLLEMLEKVSKNWGSNGKKQMLNFVI